MDIVLNCDSLLIYHCHKPRVSDANIEDVSFMISQKYDIKDCF
jgi:hypothetical protein